MTLRVLVPEKTAALRLYGTNGCIREDNINEMDHAPVNQVEASLSAMRPNASENAAVMLHLSFEATEAAKAYTESTERRLHFLNVKQPIRM
jgi:hypothetical protein